MMSPLLFIRAIAERNPGLEAVAQRAEEGSGRFPALPGHISRSQGAGRRGHRQPNGEIASVQIP